MSRAEWMETAFIFAALGLLWVPIVKPVHPLFWWALYATVPILLWIAWRRWRRLNEVLRWMQRDDETFRPLPPPKPPLKR